MHRKRIREYGFIIGNLNPGRNNAITDVEGVRVGHTTVIHDGEGAFPPGKGPARTGVTVVLPHAGDVYMKKAHAAVHTINGHGKVFGLYGETDFHGNRLLKRVGSLSYTTG